ncbi:MAG TPA: ABC transporter ATP-binding protein [Gemmatimonadaceae bacterium]|nr:ABC transporter ATP-binding protein [Gemmatimonadaceae bacterium]
MRSDAVISIRDVTHYFGRRRVLDQVSLDVPRGSVFAFLGRNGSGKTTMIRIMLGLLEPTRGGTRVLGDDGRRISPETRARIGYMSESHALYDWMTVEQLGAYQATFYARWNQRIFDSVVGHFRLNRETKAGSLSRGERAGLSLAITLAPEPELLVLDDPALGLDPVARRALLESMLYVTRAADRTIFFSSHLLDDVERVADHLAILDRSVLRASCSVDAFRSSISQFRLQFAAGSVPPNLPPIRGMLHARTATDALWLTIARPDDETQRVLHSLGAPIVDEVPLNFADALTGYLGERDVRGSFLGGVA